MINKWEQWLRHWGFSQEDEEAFTRYMVNKYPLAAHAGIVQSRADRGGTPDVAVEIIADVYGYSLEQIAAPGRKREALAVMRCRATILDVLNSPLLFNLGRPEISNRFLGGRDNSTVIYTWKTHLRLDSDYDLSVRRICDLMELDDNETLRSLKAKYRARIAGDSSQAEAGCGTAGEAGA